MYTEKNTGEHVQIGSGRSGQILSDVLNFDTSGSMTELGFVPGESKKDTVCNAALEFLGVKRAQRPQDVVALIGYDTTAHVYCDFAEVGSQFVKLVSAIEEIRNCAPGSTRLVTGLKQARRIINNRIENLIHSGDDQEHAFRVIAYSDGHDFETTKGIREADAIKNSDILIETLGIAPARHEVDEGFLREVATTDSTGFTHYRFLGDAESIRDTFKSVATGTLVIE